MKLDEGSTKGDEEKRKTWTPEGWRAPEMIGLLYTGYRPDGPA